MQKLTKENIQFIENYLENSDIIYADIRMEMTDHVASAIEDKMNQGDQREFYYIFKDYMVENKARLLNDNRKFLRSADKKILRLLIKDLLTVKTLFIFLIITFWFTLLFNSIEVESFKTAAYIPVLSIIPFSLFYIILIVVYKLDRFSVIERLAFPYIILFQLINLVSIIIRSPINESQNSYVLIGTLSIFMTFVYVLIKVSLNIAFMYKKRFKNIA